MRSLWGPRHLTEAVRQGQSSEAGSGPCRSGLHRSLGTLLWAREQPILGLCLPLAEVPQNVGRFWARQGPVNAQPRWENGPTILAPLEGVSPSLLLHLALLWLYRSALSFP